MTDLNSHWLLWAVGRAEKLLTGQTSCQSNSGHLGISGVVQFFSFCLHLKLNSVFWTERVTEWTQRTVSVGV